MCFWGHVSETLNDLNISPCVIEPLQPPTTFIRVAQLATEGIFEASDVSRRGAAAFKNLYYASSTLPG